MKRTPSGQRISQAPQVRQAARARWRRSARPSPPIPLGAEYPATRRAAENQPEGASGHMVLHLPQARQSAAPVSFLRAARSARVLTLPPSARL